MAVFLPILFASLAIVFMLVLFAVFPIRITWFFSPKTSFRRKPGVRGTSRQGHVTLVDDDDYDDKEL